MLSWFSNPGQIIQVVVATVAAAVGLVLAVKQDFIPIQIALVLVGLAVVVIWLLLRKFRAPIAIVVENAVRSSPDNPQLSSLLPEKFTAKWSTETIKLKKGERW